jgi:hypothetical protein
MGKYRTDWILKEIRDGSTELNWWMEQGWLIERVVDTHEVKPPESGIGLFHVVLMTKKHWENY